MSDLRIEGLRKSFGPTPVLHGIDLAIPDGAFAVVVGPSGCGKSTLLRLVAGLEQAEAGRILLGGRDVAGLPPAARNVAMVFQNYALFPHLTVARNIGFGLSVRGAPRAEIDRRVREAAAALRLTDYLGRKPRQLSGGQRQRVAMGRAIVRDPAVFLFDEPLSNLDAQLRSEMRAEIRRLHQSLGTTAVYVTHDQVEAMTMGDVLVAMNGGRIEQIGAPIDLYGRPASEFVARFIGAPAMNLAPVRIEQGRAVSALGAVPAGDGPAPARIGIRPEHLVPSPEAPSATLEVRLVEPQGADTFARGEAGGLPVTIRLPGDAAVRVGDRIPVAMMPGRAHLFGQDGRRIGAA